VLNSPLSSLHPLHHFHHSGTRFKSGWRLPILHWTFHLLWYKRISQILTVLSVDDKTSNRLSYLTSLLDKFSEKPLKIIWKFPGTFYCILMGTTHEYPIKTFLSEVHENGKLMKFLKRVQYITNGNTMKDIWHYWLEKIYEKAMKFISFKQDLWKSHESYEKAMKIVILQLPYEKALKMFTLERAMKILWYSKNHSERDLKIDNTKVGSTKQK